MPWAMRFWKICVLLVFGKSFIFLRASLLSIAFAHPRQYKRMSSSQSVVRFGFFFISSFHSRQTCSELISPRQNFKNKFGPGKSPWWNRWGLKGCKIRRESTVFTRFKHMYPVSWSFRQGMASHSLQSVIALSSVVPWNEWAVPLKSDAIVKPYLSIFCVHLASRAHTTYVGLILATPGPSSGCSIHVASANCTNKCRGICCNTNWKSVLFLKRSWSTGWSSHPKSLHRLFLNRRLSFRLWSVWVILKGIVRTRGWMPIMPPVFWSW